MKFAKQYTTHLVLTSVAILLAACNGPKEAAIGDISAEVQDYYQTKVSLPPEVIEALERGELSQEEVDRRIAAGEFPRFFRFATPEEVPANLVWENGMDLPDLGSPDARKGGTWYEYINDFPRTLRKVGPDANGPFRNYILDDVTMALGHRHPEETEIGPTGFHVYPGLASEWAVDRPNKRVFVRLNPAARWSDGEPVTTDDFLFLFFFMQSPHIQAPWYNNAYNRFFTGITKYDDHTFAVTVPEAKPDMKWSILTLRPVPEHFYGDFGQDYVERYQWKFEPTTGPYVVREEDINKGRSVTLTRNDDWWARDMKFWRNRFNPDRIRLTVIRDMDKAFEAFKVGQLDAFAVTLPKYYYDKLPDDAEEIRDGFIHKATFYNVIPRPSYAFRINTSKPLLDNRDIRLGINYASNWELVASKYFRGDATRMRTTSDGYGEFTEPTLQPYPFSVVKALEHFAKAGFRNRGADGILVNDSGQRLSFTLTSPYRSAEDMLPILKDEAAKAGLELRLEILDLTAGYKKIDEKNHEIAFAAFASMPEMYPRYWESFHGVNAYDRPYLSDGSPNPERKPKPTTNNLTCTAIPELDQKIETYRASEDVEEMKRLAHEMEHIIHDYGAWVPAYKTPFFRTAYWRWMRWPDDFNVKIATKFEEYYLFWIDEEMKRETLSARDNNGNFPPAVRVYDRYKQDL